MACGAKNGEKMVSVCLGLGSNIENRISYLRDAVRLLDAYDDISVVEVSPVYETDPIDMPSDYKFLNAVVRIDTTCGAHELLDRIHVIEDELGRKRLSYARYMDRTIDIDILLYADLVCNETHLTIPHPRLHERAFVLVPLAEVAADLVHPVLHRPIRQLRDTVESSTVYVWKEANWYAKA